MKHGRLTWGQTEALVNMVGGERGVMEVLRGALKLVPSTPKWFIGEDGLVHFSLTADGTTGAGWKRRLERGGYSVKQTELNQLMFEPRHFRPTSATSELVILPGWAVSKGTSGVSPADMYAEARRRRLKRPNSEVGPLMRELFSWDNIVALDMSAIFIAHKPVEECGHNCNFFMDDRAGGRWLSVYQEKDHTKLLHDDTGYVFEVSGK